MMTKRMRVLAQNDWPSNTRLQRAARCASRDVVWGKTYWIFEQLRAKYGEDFMAKYFRTKRALLKPGRDKYSLDDCVAVWSRALGEDLFPWFQSLGINVSKENTDIPLQ